MASENFLLVFYLFFTRRLPRENHILIFTNWLTFLIIRRDENFHPLLSHIEFIIYFDRKTENSIEWIHSNALFCLRASNINFSSSFMSIYLFLKNYNLFFFYFIKFYWNLHEQIQVKDTEALQEIYSDILNVCSHKC